MRWNKIDYDWSGHKLGWLKNKWSYDFSKDTHTHQDGHGHDKDSNGFIHGAGHHKTKCPDSDPEDGGRIVANLTAQTLEGTVVHDFDAADGFVFRIEEIGDDSDADLFSIDPVTGELTWEASPTTTNFAEINNSDPDFYVIADNGVDSIQYVVDTIGSLGG